MFILDEERVVRWPVTIGVPVDGGGTVDQEFEASFKLKVLNDDDIRNVLTKEGVREALVGWSGVRQALADGGSREIPFSAEKLEIMLGIPYARRGLIAAYAACLAGAKRKNSERPRSDGPAAGTPAPETTK